MHDNDNLLDFQKVWCRVWDVNSASVCENMDDDKKYRSYW